MFKSRNVKQIIGKESKDKLKTNKKWIPLQFSLWGDHHLTQNQVSNSHWEKSHCKKYVIRWSLPSSQYPKYSMLDCLMHLAKTHNKQSNINRTLHSFYQTLHKMKGNISPGRKKSKNTEIKQMECYGRMRTLTPMLHQHSPIL